MAKKLKKLTQKEFDIIATKHLAYLAGDSESKADLSYRDFSGIDLRKVDLSGANLAGSDLSQVYQNGYSTEWSLDWLILSGADLSDTILPDLSFERVKVDWTILIGAHYDQKQFTPAQKKVIVVTKEQLVQTIQTQEKTIQKQEITLEQVGENHVMKLKGWFSSSHASFKNEEITWLKIAIFIFIVLSMLSFFPIILALGVKQVPYIVLFFLLTFVVLIVTIINAVTSVVSSEESGFEKFMSKWSWIFSVVSLAGAVLWIHEIGSTTTWAITISLEGLYPFIPFELICAVFLYFCISQYTKAKTLRIEFQNKLAVIDGYMGLTAQPWTDSHLNLFLPNISEVLFTKVLVKWEKESNLPVDEILRIVELVTKKK